MGDFGQIGNCTWWAVHVFLDVQRALASVSLRELAQQKQSPPAAKAAHAKHSRRGNRRPSIIGARLEAKIDSVKRRALSVTDQAGSSARHLSDILRTAAPDSQGPSLRLPSPRASSRSLETMEGTPRGPTTDSGALSAAGRAGGELEPPVGAAAEELRSSALRQPAAMSRLGVAHVAVEMAELKPNGVSTASLNATPTQADMKLARMLCDDGEPSRGRDGGELSLGSLEAV